MSIDETKFYFIVNPSAGSGLVGRKWPEIRGRLESESFSFHAELTHRAKEATELTRKALVEGYRHFISVGGDGTNHEIINGLFNQKEEIPPEVTLGFFPAGSGNDFLRFLKVPSGFDKAFERLHSQATTMVDIGKMRFSFEGTPREEFFISVAGTGFTADVTKTANDHFKFLGKLCYAGGFFPNILSFKNIDLDITIDGIAYRRKSCMTVVANTAYFGGGMMIAPSASVIDGLFEVLLFREFSRLELIANFPGVFKGTHVKHPKVEVFRGRTVTIRSAAPQNLLADGEIIGQTPVEFSCLPGVLKIRI